MNRAFNANSGVPRDGSPPSEAWLFAQAILGKPIPRIVSPERKARAEREELQRLALFSTRHADELRKLEAAEAAARHDREILEWAAGISTEAEAKLRALQRKEAEEREAWRRAEIFAEQLLATRLETCEFRPRGGEHDTSHPSTIVEWDPNQPRDNLGRWTSTGGGGAGGGTSGAGGSTRTASDSGSIKAIASLASWHPPVGHHYVPVGVTQHPDIRPFLSDEAVEYAAGAYSGPTNPPHGNTTAAEITHPKYSAEVKKEMETFIGAQMKRFSDLMENGLDAGGKPHRIIGEYNGAIKKMLPKGAIGKSTKFEDVLAAGRKYMKHSRFRLLAAGAVVSGILGEVVAAQVSALEVAADSGYYKRALHELQNGNLDKARRLLLADDQSLYAEILGHVGAHAALNFRRAMEKVFEDATNRDYK